MWYTDGEGWLGHLPGVPQGEAPEGPTEHQHPEFALSVQALPAGDYREYRSA